MMDYQALLSKYIQFVREQTTDDILELAEFDERFTPEEIDALSEAAFESNPCRPV